MSISVREYELRAIAERYEIAKPQWELEKPFLEGPSWSWDSADVSDRLGFWGDHDEKYRMRVWSEHDAEILEAEVEQVGKLEFGRVTSGKLLLRGYTYPRGGVRTSGWDPKDSISSVILELYPHSPWNRDQLDACQDKVVIWDYGPRQRYPSVARLLLHIALWFLGIIFAGSGQSRRKDLPYLHGILVRQCSFAGGSSFQWQQKDMKWICGR